MAEDLPILSPAEARVLGCLIEKKETTPDVYPMTLNALQSAANQKTSREPVMALEQHDILRALKLLEQKGLVRQMFASRVERYEHMTAQRFSLTQPQIAIVGLLMLRGPQTAYELLSRSERMARISSIEDLKTNLDLLIGRHPPLIVELGRAPGQREERFAHLLSGEPAMPVAAAHPVRGLSSDLEERVRVLEEQVAELKTKLRDLTG
ncbi:MAG: YceH family protein [Rhizobiaceae bacterium]